MLIKQNAETRTQAVRTPQQRIVVNRALLKTLKILQQFERVFIFHHKKTKLVQLKFKLQTSINDIEKSFF